MTEIIIKELDEKRFNALAGFSRSPASAYVSKELAWYSNEDETILGVLLLDIIDKAKQRRSKGVSPGQAVEKLF
jgi:hypothetical protein